MILNIEAKIIVYNKTVIQNNIFSTNYRMKALLMKSTIIKGIDNIAIMFFCIMKFF